MPFPVTHTRRKTRTIRPPAPSRRLAAWALAGLSVATVYAPITASAASSTWTNPLGGSWSLSGNWLGGVIPGATDAFADFSTLALSASETVTLDGDLTVGSLKFGDAGLTPASDWTLVNGTGGPWTLTLATSVGAPVINVVNRNATISAIVAGAQGFTKIGNGNLILTAANTYTGTTTVKAGTLTLDFSQSGSPATNIINSASGITLGGGGFSTTLNVIGKASTANSQTFDGLTLNAGAASLSASANATGNPVLIALGAITRNIGSTVNFTPPTGTISATNGFTTSTANAYGAGANAILGGWATVGTTDFATNNGTNIVAATSTSSGTNTAASFYNGINVNINNNVTPDAAITPNSIRFANTANRTVTLTGANVIASGGILVSSVATNLATLTGGTLTSGNGQALIVIQNNSTTNLVIASVISDNGGTPIGLTKSGSGNLVLQALNTYTGPTNINGGTITLNTNNNVIGSSSVVTINGGTLTLANNITNIVAGVIVKSGNIVGSNASSTITSTSAFDLQSGSVSAVLAGSVGLIKTTDGLVTLTRINTFTGTTQIKEGTLKQGVASALPTAVTLGTAATSIGATLDLGGFNASIAGLNSTGTGTNIVTNSGAGPNTLTISAASTWAGSIQDGTGVIAVVKSNAGTITFSGVNTYSGGTTINNGTVILSGGNDRLFATGALSLGNSGGVNVGILQLGNATAPINQTVASIIRTAGNTSNAQRVVGGYYDAGSPQLFSTFTVNCTNTATPDTYAGLFGSGTAGANAANNLALTKTGAGTLILSPGGLNTYIAGTNVNGGTLAYGAANALPTTGAVNIGGGALDLAGFDGTVGAVTLTTGSIVNSGGAATLTGSSYTVQSGTISAALGGVDSVLTKTTGGTVTLSGANTYLGGTNVNAGTLALGATNTLAAGGAVTVSGGILDLAGFSNAVGTITLTSGSIVNGGGAAVLTGSSYAVQSGTISAVLAGSGSALTKTTGGTVTLSATNTYTGLTTVSAGTLNLTAAQTGGGAFTIGDGATLGVKVTTAGQSLVTSTFTVGSVSGGTLTLDLGTFGNPSSPIINASTLEIHGTSILKVTGGGLSLGQFTLLDYTGTIGGDGFGALSLGTLPARVLATLVNNTVNTSIDLHITAIDVPRWTGLAGGTPNGTWDIDDGAGTQNWKLSNNSATGYLQGPGGTDSVIFDDSATGTTNVNLTTTFTPISVTVNNSALTYTFFGTGKLSGATGLEKQGTGTLILANTGGNDFAGTTSISGGTVQIGNGATAGAGQLGSGNVVLGAAGALTLNRPLGDDFTLANNLSGAGTLAQQGGNVVTLAGNNSGFSGAFTATGGTLRIGSATAIGSASGTVQGSGILDVTGYGIGNTLTLSGGGTLRVTTGAGSASTGTLTLGTGGGIARVSTGATLTISGPIGGSGGLTKNSGGTLVLSGNNSFAGATVINTGVIRLGNANALGSTAGDTTVESGATLDLAGFIIGDAVQLNGGTLQSSTGAGGGVSGLVTLNTAGGLLDVVSGTTLTLSNSVGGVGALVKNSAGTLVLSASNSYAGGTTLNNGTLVLATAASVPATGTISYAAGTTLAFGFAFDQALLNARVAPTSNAATFALGANNANNLDFTNYSATSLGAFGAFTYSGTLTPAGATYLLGGGGGTLTVSSLLTGARNLTIGSTGAGTVILTGANTFTGAVSVANGTLKLGNASALGATTNALTVTTTLDLNGYSLTVGSLTSGSATALITDLGTAFGTSYLTVNIASGSSTYSGSISEGFYRSVALVKAGSGTLVLNKANGADYTGGLYLQGGLLDVRSNIAQVLSSVSDVTFTGTSTLRTNNNSTASPTLLLPSLAFEAGLGTLENWKGSTGAGNVVRFTGLLSRANGAGGNFILSNGATAPGYRYVFSSGAIPTNQLLNGGIYYQGSDFAVEDEDTLIGVRALNYLTDHNVGNAVLAEDQATLATAVGLDVFDLDLQLGGAGHITAQIDETIHSLKIAGANNLTLDNGATLTITSGGLLKTGGNASVISGGAGLTTDSSGDLVVRTAAAGDTLTISTAILASTSGGVTKSGLGTLVLSGNNTYSGVTNILEGTLRLGSATAFSGTADGTVISTGGTLDVAGFITAESLQLNGGTLTTSTGAVGGVTGLITLLANSSISAAASSTITLSNVISGSFGLTKTLTGTAIFSAPNTYTGLTTISAGIINYQHGIAFGTNGAITVASGATAQVQGGIAGGNFALTLSGVGATAAGATGALQNVSGHNSYAGLIALGAATTISSEDGTLALTNTGAINGTNVTLTLAGAGNGGIAGSISTGTGALIKNGAGAWTLSGANTYTGATTVNGGTLKIGNSGALATSSSLTIGAGLVDVSGFNASTAGALTFGATTTTTGGLTASLSDTAGGGSYTLNGNITYNTGSAGFHNGQATISAKLDLGGADRTFTVNDSVAGAVDLDITGVISGGFGLIKANGGTLRLSGANSFTGQIQLNNGVTLVTTIGNIGAAGSLGTGDKDVTAGIIRFGATANTGTLEYVGSGESSNRRVQIGSATGATATGGATILNNGSGALVFTAATFNSAVGVAAAGPTAARVLTLGGSNTGANTIQGAIINNTGAGTSGTNAVALQKQDAGTWILEGASTYSGGTTVSGGTLLVSGSLSGTTSVAVNAGGTLGGSGTITTGANGNVTVANGGQLSPGTNSASTLSLELGTGQLDVSLASAGTGWLKFELGAASDQILLTSGTLNLGTGLDLNSFSFTNSGGFGGGTYVLFATSNNIVGTLGSTLTGQVLGFDATLSLADGGSDLVLIVVPEPGAITSLLGGFGLLLGLQRFRRRFAV